ncbi:hypothetical protein [Fulvivirga lutea]|uniref:GLPGLI family protein n=1 Tax=Fulvivirga lutea TaxID=2810512 RepID=A0A974WJ23_9BACT|nr:hypothetical protein [Fulvivirga lutea]QSE98678.1 hypothetical protein JR347_06250 [Fulvivirga lutea]
MKKLISLLLFLTSFHANGQDLQHSNENTIHQVKNLDFARLINTEFKHEGIIGQKFRRITFKFSNVSKTENDFIYSLKGKSKVGNNIVPFEGNLMLSEAHQVESEIIDVEGVITGHFILREDPTNKSSGIFEGQFTAYWSVEDNQVVKANGSYVILPRIWSFIGKWKGYNSKNEIVCCWSDYQIPCTPEDFNISDGPDVIPNSKYDEVGWWPLRIIYTAHPDSEEWKKASEIEKAKWWE